MATTLLVALHWGLARLSALSPVVSRFLEGRPIVVGEHGSLSHGALLRCGLSANDLFEAFRQKELTAESDTRLVIMEPNGKLSVFKK